MRFRYDAGSWRYSSATRNGVARKQSARARARAAILVISCLNAGRIGGGGDVSMPDGIMVAADCRAALSPGPETSNNLLSIAPHGAAASRVLMISFRALWALLLPGTAPLSTPVDVGAADGSDGYCRVPAVAMMHHRVDDLAGVARLGPAAICHTRTR